MKQEEIIDTLNDLIKVCNDGMEGFKACAENANIDSPELKTLLIERAHNCELAAAALSELVRKEGGVPATTTTASGALRRGWLNVKTAVSGNTDRVVLEECERGEDVAKNAYQKALGKDLPESARLVVDQQYRGVITNLEQIKKLHEEAKMAHT
jgi:uncharacterized protein (TIGR02284 family)